jgi:2-hydroxyglutarate dehydrogenase
MPPSHCDLTIIGGGIVGLAVARELALSYPRLSLCVLERESELASHQSSRNSGVVHAGIYYRPGSLKARLCVQGARELYDYCARRGVAYERCGKIIVAAERSELPRLEELGRRGTASGVGGLRRLDALQIAELEPHARGVAAIHSPTTGIVDFAELARCFAEDLSQAGQSIFTDCEVLRVSTSARRLSLWHSRGVTQSTHAIFCAGGWADRLAVAAGADPDPRVVPFRGAYMRLVPARSHLVRSLIYPVPDPGLPFLGIHLSRHISGEVLLGPSALPVGARDAYRLSRIRARDLTETLSWPGSWRLLARWWRSGIGEIHNAARRSAFVASAGRYLPELRESDLTPAFAGVRAQAVARDGRLVDDFLFSFTERALHVRNAPSPAATCSLSIARHIREQAARTFGLGDPQSA